MSGDLSTGIWAVSLAVVGLIVSTYAIAIRRRERRARDRVAEAERLGTSKPTGKYPFIDPMVCIGCGGCIAACPEGDVLGLVGGLAVVVNGARCIGIGQCAKACPVGGIELAVGSLKGRVDVPEMDAANQSNIPGLFIAGELGGLALIRNAIEQGSEAARRIAAAARSRPNPRAPGVLDLLIVGAGPAGIAAALAATEEGLVFEVLEQEGDLGGTIFNFPRRKLAHTQPVSLPFHGPLHRGEYSKEELLALFEGLVAKLRLPIRFGERVEKLERRIHGFELRTAGGAFHSRFVLLALGRRGTPRKLGVPGEALPKVMYQVRDAEEYRDCRILCVGGGDSAVEAATGLARRAGNVVTLSYRGKGFSRVKRKNEERLRQLERRGRVRVLFESQVREIGSHAVRLASTRGELTLENDFVFVLVGGEPPFDLLRSWGIRFGGDSPGAPDGASPEAAGLASAWRAMAQ